MVRKAALICSEKLWARGHGKSHPLRPERLRMTYELLQAYHAFDAPNSRLVPPHPATEEELTLWHTVEYIDVVRRLGAGDKSVPARRHNLGPGDNPVFPGMYETEALKAGSSLMAARLVVDGKADVAFSFSGGLHHAMSGYASGFCVFNDAAIAIRWLTQQGLRVVYVDIDAHHGDGVQAAFYDTAQVMTISLHESGEYLFPGTGFVQEMGRGAGRGYSINVPLLPFTDDDIYVQTFEQVVPPLVADFCPDILVTQLGVDAHYADPLAHLRLSTAGYVSLFRSFHEMNLPWIAMGGGGYNVHTVARAWTLAYGIMNDQEFADEIPEPYAQTYGDRWLHDHNSPQLSGRDRALARDYAERQVAMLKRALGNRRFSRL
jgi:acetoin utilization protein AcuC